MNRMKPRNTKTSKATKPVSTRDISTQTVNSNILIEIAELQKQVEFLQLENDTLRKQMPTSTKAVNTSCVSSLGQPQEMTKINVKITICGCKGNCSSRRCGCVKENNKCTGFCKCSSEICQNQELGDQSKESDQENKENICMNSMAIPEKQELIQNDIAVKTKQNNNLATDKIRNHMEEQFDPMKPRYQLSRTPPKKNKSVDEKIHMNNMHQPESPQIIASSFKKDMDLSNEEQVDWMQHTAQLIPCKKCNRTFMPYRIKKHEACCKKI